MTLWFLGDPGQALQGSREVLAFAEEWSAPSTLAEAWGYWLQKKLASV